MPQSRGTGGQQWVSGDPSRRTRPMPEREDVAEQRADDGAGEQAGGVATHTEDPKLDGDGAAAGAPSQAQPPGDWPTGSRARWILIVCCVAQFMVILDLSIVNVALPSIQSSLNFSSADLQWVVDAYAITFASFLMLGGRAADRLGHRRVFVSALILFGLASLAGGAAQTQEMLVFARAVQGFSCSFMAASSLAIITSSVP